MSMPLISMPKAPTDQHRTEQGKWRWDWFDRYTLWFHVFILGTIRCRERFFSSYHERGTKKKFWVPMRNRTSDLRIPRSDALPLSHRLYGELSDVLYQLNAWHTLNNIIFKERCWLFCRSFRTEKYIWIPMRNRTACIPSLQSTTTKLQRTLEWMIPPYMDYFSYLFLFQFVDQAWTVTFILSFTVRIYQL